MMNASISILTLIISSAAMMTAVSFKSEQLKNNRVKTAYQEKEAIVKSLLSDKNITSAHIYIRAFKKEEVLEVLARSKSDQTYKKVIQYDFCTSSGILGPKRQQGDYQIPEGFYHIDRFNPWSNFYLSLGINYPNSSDRILGNKQNLGGDIFIHGSCVTIGCIPLTDDKIKELYVFAVEAKNNGQSKIPVHIFPTKMTDWNMAGLKSEYESENWLLDFWENLKEGYDYFEAKKTLPTVSVSSTGAYKFK